MNRRQVLQFAVSAAVAATLASTCPDVSQAKLARGASGLPSGFLAVGHYLPRLQSLVVIYPRPDTETASYARHHFAFWDGAHPMLFDLPIDVIGGAYPHVPVLISGPPGMSVLLPTYSSGPPYASPRLQWTPTGPWSGIVTVRWYSQEYQTDPTQYIDQTFFLVTSNSIASQASFNGSISGTTLTVNSGTAPSIGMVIGGSGVAEGTVVTSGSGTSWTVSVSQTVSSEAMLGSGVFIFANKDTGSSSNSGAYASPIDDWPTAAGSTYTSAPTIGGVATAGKILVLMGGTTGSYTLPLYVNGSVTQYQPDNTKKPAAVIGFPGLAQPKFSAALASASGVATPVIGFSTNVSDSFYSYLNPDGYNASNLETRLFSLGGSGVNRFTLDSVTWTNSGYGTSGTDNSTILESSNVSSYRQYIYCNNCSEPSRQSGNPGNNFAGPDYYSIQYGLIQGYTCNNPAMKADSGCFLKVDCANCEVRGAYYNVASGTLYPCSTGEAVLETTSYCDITYNLLINCQNIKNPGLNSGSSVQTFYRAGRNTVLSPSGAGIIAGTPNAGAGPFAIDSNIAQGTSVVLPTAGSNGVTTDGLNVFSTATGVIDTTTGLLTSTYKTAHPGVYGTIGAEIA